MREITRPDYREAGQGDNRAKLEEAYEYAKKTSIKLAAMKFYGRSHEWLRITFAVAGLGTRVKSNPEKSHESTAIKRKRTTRRNKGEDVESRTDRVS